MLDGRNRLSSEEPPAAGDKNEAEAAETTQEGENRSGALVDPVAICDGYRNERRASVRREPFREGLQRLIPQLVPSLKRATVGACSQRQLRLRHLESKRGRPRNRHVLLGSVHVAQSFASAEAPDVNRDRRQLCVMGAKGVVLACVGCSRNSNVSTGGLLVRLAVGIARRILYREIQVDGEALMGLIHAATQQSQMRELNRILLNPSDLEALRPHLERLRLPPRVEVVADSGLERGALMLESTSGVLDASRDGVQ